MRRVGRVLARPVDGRVAVELDPAPACARCARGRGCGAALFAPRSAPLRVDCAVPAVLPGAAPVGPDHPDDRGGPDRASGSAGAAAGDALDAGARVVVEIDPPGRGWLVPVSLAYGLPTLGLLGGAFAPEPWTPFAALAGLVGGLLAWRALAAHDAVAATSCAAAGTPSGPSPAGARIAAVEEPESSGERP